MDKKGQIAIFVIVALVVVGVIVVIFAYPQISNLVAPREIAPGQYLKDCLQPEVKVAIDLLAKQGGTQNPSSAINYLDNKVSYLCYSSGYYKPCIVQQPLLITNFASEVSGILAPKAERCMKNLITEYERRGYSVSSSTIKSSISLAPGNVRIEYSAPMTVTIEQTTKTFDKFDVGVESSIYDLLAVATSLLDFEATYGDSETTLYMRSYPNLKIDKIRLEDGVKVYKLTDVVTNDMFQFATRSLVWPPGYGL